jgi:hypothetical protein
MRYAPLVALLLLPLPALAQDAAPEIRQFDIATIEKLGREMYEQDQFVWHATDALMAIHPASEMQQMRIHGWIVEEGPAGNRVRYIREGANGPEAAFDIGVAAGKWNVSEPQDRILNDTEKAQYQARILALKSVSRPCSGNYNTVVLQDPEGDDWLVWALASSTMPETWFVGGNYRFTISKDGSQILRADALSHGCLIMTEPAAQENQTLSAMLSSQLVSDIPVETVVFINLESKLPMIVVTPSANWEVRNGNIRLLEQKGPPRSQ